MQKEKKQQISLICAAVMCLLRLAVSVITIMQLCGVFPEFLELSRQMHGLWFTFYAAAWIAAAVLLDALAILMLFLYRYAMRHQRPVLRLVFLGILLVIALISSGTLRDLHLKATGIYILLVECLCLAAALLGRCAPKKMY